MTATPRDWLIPDWPAPAWLKAISTTRTGGSSQGVFASLNLGDHVGDDLEHVKANRAFVAETLKLPATIAWLSQVHGTAVLDVADWQGEVVQADASFSRNPQQACVVMTADCLPVLFCCLQTRQVAAAHAGWRGLCDGVLEQTLSTFSTPDRVMAWLGPCIGPTAFEVGADVRTKFVLQQPEAAAFFTPAQQNDKWFADLAGLARLRLQLAGVSAVYGGEHCTFSNPARFFSYRRDGQTGRMASLIWTTAEST